MLYFIFWESQKPKSAVYLNHKIFYE